MIRQRLAILGSTGSIGASTLDVVARHPDRYEVVVLSAGSRVEPMLAQCAQFRPRFAVMADEGAARELQARVAAEGLPTAVLGGDAALDQLVVRQDVDAVMAAIVGAAGLSSCLAAARAGKRLLLANKEALVVGGELFLQAVREGGATLLPIDSEHSAIFQSLPEDPASWDERVDKIILTASGGPFRRRAPESLREVTPEQACAHPNWVMGRKISVDSATMMNKALEVIEARYLFGLPPERLQVVIHPQSVIHSMVQYRDHSVVAQLGTPDMRVPIAYGLAWPERIASGAEPLDFTALADMSFESLDSHGHRERFPGLQLAWDALRAPAGTTAVLNAANEEAVAAFLDRRIRFDRIHAVNLATLERVQPSKPQALADLLALDALARQAARAAIARFG
ncbi:1-deoxy-D-xylulose-5-phosphate reductoisomerase [Ramlibacter tataouinensis]|uniref:1-deoxy-D-xylulose-5-phosphate reductoisomerase n=1 Tax=Ramlibacter tataouinensis TaxID=94132 RepID=UPI0022F3B384|nr:1-deoxy-D-xylulose-5-phosphate reductoisomerase [Ramlibacter tataouinensis]WBY02262.1 1-deoxy-D-xylulose-5-phosphate reductoisomerase [Ramlibacter tataouinensis]